jgi:nitrogen regulatory protein PII-like uncharacterized protein
VKSFWSAAKTDATEQQRKDATNGIKGMFYNKKYDGLLPTEMRWLKRFEEENSKLKELVASLSLDKEMLQDVIRWSYKD